MLGWECNYFGWRLHPATGAPKFAPVPSFAYCLVNRVHFELLEKSKGWVGSQSLVLFRFLGRYAKKSQGLALLLSWGRFIICGLNNGKIALIGWQDLSLDF